MIFLLTRLLLHTIHNLEAEGAVFDPGKVDVLRLINAASGWSEAGKEGLLGSLRTSFLRGRQCYGNGSYHTHVSCTGSFNEAVRGLLEGGARIVRIG